MTNPLDGASQFFKASPAKRLNELISQKQREVLLTQIVAGVYDHSIVDDNDDAIQDENRNPYFLYLAHNLGAQTLGIGKVVPSPNICLTMQHNSLRSYLLRVQAIFGISHC